MNRFSIEAFDKERLSVIPNANEIICACTQKSMQDMHAAELQSLTNATTLWIPNGDHAWRHDESIVETRFLAHELTQFPRASGEPECTHGLGSADLMINAAEMFNIPRLKQIDPILQAFVLVNHDRPENNRAQNINWVDIFEASWRGGAFWKPIGMFYLFQLTDSKELHGDERFAEQVVRANMDKTLFIPTARICEKLNAGLQDAHNLATGHIPFNNIGRYAKYVEKRVQMAEAIKVPEIKELKKYFVATLQDNLKAAKKIGKKPFRCVFFPTAKQPNQAIPWPNSYLTLNAA